jgi:histidine triad (HIT) family protein
VDNQCIFCKIVSGDLPTELIYSDDLVVGFRDINPQAPVHVLIIPRKHIPAVCSMSEEDSKVLGHLHLVAKQLAEQLGIARKGYRLVINCGEDGQQSVPHLHLHLLGGRQLTWPPG